jgi:hypothetical protein
MDPVGVFRRILEGPRSALYHEALEGQRFLFLASAHTERGDETSAALALQRAALLAGRIEAQLGSSYY